MSYIGTFSKCLFGRSLVNDQAARSAGGANAQTTLEQISSTTSRVIAGPREPGVFTYHIRSAAGGGTGNMTIWYSNLPNPNPDDDTHWVDSCIAPIDLSLTGNVMGHPNVYAAHIRFKITHSSNTLQVNVWVRVPGVEG